MNVRYLEPSSLPAPFDLIVVDVSFISLRLVLPALAPLLGRSTGPLPPAGNADHPPQPPLPAIVALVKPQFEVGRGQVGKGGIVRDPALHLEALLGVLRPLREPAPDAPREAAPLSAWRILESPIRGAEGNREFFVYLVPGYDRSWTDVEDEARRVACRPVSPQ